MANNFSLSSLIPEGPTFTDDGKGGDGTVYEVLLPADFDSFQYARMAQLQEELPKHLQTVAALGESGPEAAQAAQLLDSVINDFFHLIVPDLSEERVKAVRLGHKMEFIRWWRQQLPKAADQAKAAQRLGELKGRAKTKTPRGKRSPDLSTSTT